MKLQGSCHCQSVKFSVEADNPYPFASCYCSICRKTAGAGGYAINVSGHTETMTVDGGENIRTYHARLVDDDTGAASSSSAERKFCGLCGSGLWVWHPEYPDRVYLHVSAIDTPLPTPPEHTHVFLGSKANWVEPCIREGDKEFDKFPDESLAGWKRRVIGA